MQRPRRACTQGCNEGWSIRVRTGGLVVVSSLMRIHVTGKAKFGRNCVTLSSVAHGYLMLSGPRPITARFE